MPIAIGSCLSCGIDIAKDITYQALFVGVEIAPFVPVPGLALASKILLNIWDLVRKVDVRITQHHLTSTFLVPPHLPSIFIPFYRF